MKGSVTRDWIAVIVHVQWLCHHAIAMTYVGLSLRYAWTNAAGTLTWLRRLRECPQQTILGTVVSILRDMAVETELIYLANLVMALWASVSARYQRNDGVAFVNLPRWYRERLIAPNATTCLEDICMGTFI